MANATQVLINSATANGSQTSITFSSIPSTYTDLLVQISARSTVTGSTESIYYYYNGANSNNNDRYMLGSGSAASSNQQLVAYGGELDTGNQTANTFSSHEIYIPNYSSTSNFKSSSVNSVEENNGTTCYMAMAGNLWSSTAAITSITITTSGSNDFVSGSNFYLYGIKNS